MEKEKKVKKPKKEKKTKTAAKVKTSKIKSFFIKLADNTPKIDKKDLIIMGIFVVFYLIISFYHLGVLDTPKTYYKFEYAGDSVSLMLANGSQEVSKVRYYTGPEVGSFQVLGSDDGETYTEITTFEETYVFAWEDLELDSTFKYIKFVSNSEGSYIGEVQLYDKYGEKILAQSLDDDSNLIVDEMDSVPATISYLNSSYFDEIYFARSAYEYVNGINAMEWTHPPLGKLIMAIPILLFGMSTFSYRLMGTIAGLLMIPVIYIFAKRIFKSRKWAALAGILMTFDTFHFAQTRMGTTDSFLVLFIMLAALFMYQYISLDDKAKLKDKLRNLFLSGLFIGCSIATKWTGLYALLALAIVFFIDLVTKELKKSKTEKGKIITLNKVLLVGLYTICIIPIAIYYITLLTVSAKLATTLVIIYYGLLIIGAMIYYMVKINKEAWKIILPCILFFIIIPVVIYILCYLLFPNVYGYTDNSISGIINQIKNMYEYHSQLTATHDFSSKWYTWPIMEKPVWYYVGYYGGTIKSTIVGIGNPAIWWFGVLAFIYLLINILITKKKEYIFILVFILCSLLPYALIDRVMFMYHYFPTLPFIMLAIVALVKFITDRLKDNSFYIFYIALVILMFIIFYPVVSGVITTSDYIDSLKWLSTWIF